VKYQTSDTGAVLYRQLHLYWVTSCTQ